MDLRAFVGLRPTWTTARGTPDEVASLMTKWKQRRPSWRGTVYLRQPSKKNLRKRSGESDIPHSRCSRVLTPDKRQALEAELLRVKAWCIRALPGLPIASAEYNAVSVLLDGVHAAEERLGLRKPHVGALVR